MNNTNEKNFSDSFATREDFFEYIAKKAQPSDKVDEFAKFLADFWDNFQHWANSTLTSRRYRVGTAWESFAKMVSLYDGKVVAWTYNEEGTSDKYHLDTLRHWISIASETVPNLYSVAFAESLASLCTYIHRQKIEEAKN